MSEIGYISVVTQSNGQILLLVPQK